MPQQTTGGPTARYDGSGMICALRGSAAYKGAQGLIAARLCSKSWERSRQELSRTAGIGTPQQAAGGPTATYSGLVRILVPCGT